MQVNDIFEKNLEAIGQVDIVLYQKVLQYISDRPEQEELVQIEYLENGDAVLSVAQNNRIWYMNSRYSEEEFKTIWCAQFENASYLVPYIIFGFGTGSFIRKLNENLAETNIVLVVEPNPEIFLNVLWSVDISDIIYDKNIILAVKGINEDYILGFMNHVLNYGRMRTVQYGVLPNYLKLYRNEWNNLRAIIKETCEREVLNRNTSIVYAKEFATNIFGNLMDLPKQYIINQIKEICNQLDISEVPAIIVSAGPSLDKNIEELKNAENKAFIIATDSAIKPLLRRGIVPDVAVTLDPHKPPTLFFDTKAFTIPLVVCCASNKRLWTLHKGKRFYFAEGNAFVDEIYNKYGNILLQPLDTGGSVANNCFSFARYLGFQKIILIGQDLGYPEKKRHAFAVYDSADMAKDDRQYVEVEDIYGNMIITDLNMESYLRWFEGQIVLYPDVKVIDATEGGAKISGAEIITLKEAIQRECRREIHVKELIEQLQPVLPQEVQNSIYKYYASIPEELHSIKIKIKDGMKQYEKLLNIYRTKGTGSKEYQKLVKKIGKLTKMIEELPILALVDIYNQIAKYQVLGEAYVVKENIEDEVEAIVSSGIKMLKSYEKAIDEFCDDFEKQNHVDAENVLARIKANCNRATQIMHHIKEKPWAETNRLIVLLMRGTTNIMDLLESMNTSGVCNSIRFEEALYLHLKEMLQAQERKDYSMIEQILEQHYLPTMQALIGVIESVQKQQMGSGEVL